MSVSFPRNLKLGRTDFLQMTSVKMFKVGTFWKAGNPGYLFEVLETTREMVRFNITNLWPNQRLNSKNTIIRLGPSDVFSPYSRPPTQSINVPSVTREGFINQNIISDLIENIPKPRKRCPSDPNLILPYAEVGGGGVCNYIRQRQSVVLWDNYRNSFNWYASHGSFELCIRKTYPNMYADSSASTRKPYLPSYYACELVSVLSLSHSDWLT